MHLEVTENETSTSAICGFLFSAEILTKKDDTSGVLISVISIVTLAKI